MAETVVTVDTLPDSDSFLPRYLIVQLLEILAETLSANTPQTDSQPSEHAAAFIETFKSPLLFTPLTFSIFWRENVQQELEKNINLLNTTDQYNHAPLTIALANQDFILANQLVKQGAKILLEDKLVLEIALTSMIQNDENIIAEILTNSEQDLEWLSEYLLYLQGYVTGEIMEEQTFKYHEVLNPPLRYFGQVLDTLSYFNGLPSHYGFLSPSIYNLTQHLQTYTQQISNDTETDLFNKIAEAYSSALDTCKYHGNLPTVPDCATIIAANINANINTNNYNVVVVFGGWAGDCIAMAFVNKFLIFSNLGVGGNPEVGTKIYNIINQDAITPAVIDTFINGLGLATSPNTILEDLSNIVPLEHVYTLEQNLNAIDNCIFVNPRAIIEGILLVLSAYNTAKNITATTLGSQSKQVKTFYQSYVNSLHEHFTTDLTLFMRNHELLQSKRIECCSLAIDYINQHFNDADALERCIGLKNALEFVGLKNFYIKNVSDAAKTAILNISIQEQKAEAIRVIEQEYAIAAAMNGESSA